jgi:hypothetical protein
LGTYHPGILYLREQERGYFSKPQVVREQNGLGITTFDIYAGY